MIRYIIIEDEPAARRRLKRMISELRPEWDCAGTADSKNACIALFRSTEYDLIVSDIELSDGTCFEVLNQSLNVPVIFITAYDRYAIKAFDFNSIHYLLKPVNLQQLNVALHKFERQPSSLATSSLLDISSSDELPMSLVSRVGNQSTLIHIDDIAYIYYEDRTTMAYLSNGTSHILDQNLESLKEYLPENRFYRINRQAMVQKDKIRKFKGISSNRLELTLHPETRHILVVSKENSRLFKDWLNS